ncbi:hypothetical protein D3C80_1311720 [compost metagenome]
MLLKWLVDVKHGVFRLIEPRQQFVHHDQKLERFILIEALDQLLGVGLLIDAANVFLPPLGYLR